MKGPVADRLVDVQIAIPDLDVEATSGVRARPRLVMDGRSLAPKIRQRNQITGLALLTLGEAGHHYHKNPPNRT
jgi:hypothetical protein